MDKLLVLLRGDGDDPGLVGHIKRNSDHLVEVRGAVFGNKIGSGLAYQVQQLLANGQIRQTAEERKQAFIRSIISKLLTAAIIALVAFFLALYQRMQAP